MTSKEATMDPRYTVMTFVGPGSILCVDPGHGEEPVEQEPEFDDKPSAWAEARRRVRHYPDEITIVYLATGDERDAVWASHPEIVFGSAA